jgi:hypothetical protein
MMELDAPRFRNRRFSATMTIGRLDNCKPNCSRIIGELLRQQIRLPDINAMRRGLPLPPLLVSMMEAGTWIHPGTEKLREVAPFIQDPLAILPSLESMLFNSGPLMGARDTENARFHEYRGSTISARDLPWIDVEKTIFITCNERIGDDCGIALDYRTCPFNPRVICSDWHSGVNGVLYREIAESFDDFAIKSGLCVSNSNEG